MPKRRQKQIDEYESDSEAESEESDIIERILLPSRPIPNTAKPNGCIHKFTLAFLGDLKINNEREWFNINRSRYDASRDNFIELLELVLGGLKILSPDLSLITVKDGILRINKDIRFCTDKSPYKPSFAAQFTRQGKKSRFAGYYIHLEPGQSFVGCGVSSPDKAHLDNIRRGIDSDPDLLKEALDTEMVEILFGSIGIGLLDTSMKLKSHPKGYAKDHPEIALICFKQFRIDRKFSDLEVLSNDFPGLVLDACEALTPFIHALNQYLE